MILVLKVTFQEYYFLILATLQDLPVARFRWCSSHYNFITTMGAFKEMSILKANRTTRDNG
jgi:hypothetical protein